MLLWAKAVGRRPHIGKSEDLHAIAVPFRRLRCSRSRYDRSIRFRRLLRRSSSIHRTTPGQTHAGAQGPPAISTMARRSPGSRGRRRGPLHSSRSRVGHHHSDRRVPRPPGRASGARSGPRIPGGHFGVRHALFQQPPRSLPGGSRIEEDDRAIGDRRDACRAESVGPG